MSHSTDQDPMPCIMVGTGRLRNAATACADFFRQNIILGSDLDSRQTTSLLPFCIVLLSYPASEVQNAYV